jgi:type II secretory pathway pseudopilin PulG
MALHDSRRVSRPWPATARRRLRSPEAGLTLVELMVTIIVAALVASSIFVFFAGQQRIYDTQTKLLSVQQNLWAALETIARYTRGSGGGMFECEGTGLRVYNRNQGGVSRMAPILVTNGANGAPDELTLTSFSGGSGTYFDTRLETDIRANYTGSVIRGDDTEPFADGDFIVVFDTQSNPPNGDRGCTMFQVTQVPRNDRNIIVNPTSPWNAPGQAPGLIPFEYSGGTDGTFAIRNIGRPASVRFFIDSSGPATVPPRLMMDDLTDTEPAQMLAEGVEDLQVAYSCDLQPVGSPDGELTEGTDPASRVRDEWTYNESGDAVPAGCGRPIAVRITLVARTLTPDTTLIGSTGSGTASASFKPSVEDGAVGAPDQFRHRVLSTTVSPRN